MSEQEVPYKLSDGSPARTQELQKALPTVGRIVQVIRIGTLNGKTADRWCAAIVTSAPGDGLHEEEGRFDVCIFQPGHAATPAYCLVEGEGQHWRWPPKA